MDARDARAELIPITGLLLVLITRPAEHNAPYHQRHELVVM